MLTQNEISYLKTISPNKKVSISSYNATIELVVQEIVQKIKKIFPQKNILHMGASALKISGQNDVDLYFLAKANDFSQYLDQLKTMFGKPKTINKDSIAWKFIQQGFEVEFYLTDPRSDSMKRQMKVFSILKNKPEILSEYEKIKLKFDGKPFRDYQKAKYEFYNEIL